MSVAADHARFITRNAFDKMIIEARATTAWTDTERRYYQAELNRTAQARRQLIHGGQR